MTTNKKMNIVITPGLRALAFFCIAFLFSSELLAQAVTPEEVRAAEKEVIMDNGVVQLTMADVDAFAESIPKKDRIGFFDSPKRIEKTLIDLWMAKILATRAREEGVDKDPRIANIIRYKTNLVLSQAMVKRASSQIDDKTLEALAYENYLVNKADYMTPEKRKVKHILLRHNRAFDAQIRAKAEELLQQIEQHPEQFEDLARQYSDDKGSAAKGGRLPAIEKGTTEPAFDVAVFSMQKPGLVPEVVETRSGYHIIWLEDIYPAQPADFEFIKEDLKEAVRAGLADEKLTQLKRKLDSKEITVDKEAVASLRTRYGVVKRPGQK